ncbi:M14 family metallopeptidase [Oceanibium sediminis]|uniref:M14 family metallopeptidase n=1 Tax=Oceanibium sediminis TaxID=2026339 RepID=UPI000DD3233D|nr:M14 family metallopeptidase [Oceanibium sediminis]
MSATDPNKYPIELPFPDISAYRNGNSGVDYYTTFDSGVSGPHVLVNALVHGNEVCGVIALDHLFRAGVRPKRGKLTLGFANVEAYQAFDPDEPMASRFLDEDMNRVWDLETLEGARNSRELQRARQIRPLVDTVDLLFDVHSMQHKTAPVMIAGPLEKSVAMAQGLGTPDIVVADTGHAAGRRLRDYGGFGDPNSEKTALLIECGQHWEADAAQVAIDSVYRWLLLHEMIDAKLATPNLRPLPPRQRVVRVSAPVTVETDSFEFAQPFTGLETLAKGDLIGVDGTREIRAPHDDCVLIMPSRRLTPGATAVRLGRWVD